MSFGAEDVGGVTPAGSVAFDNLQGGPPPTEGWCPTSSFTDDFENAAVSHAWDMRASSSADCAFVEQAGQLQFVHTGAAYTACSVILASAYDLTEDSAVVEVPTVTAAEPHSHAWLRLEEDGDNRLELEAHDTAMRFNYEQLGSSFEVAAVPYDAVAHRWWRIREHAGTVYWETSPDGLTWTTHVSLPDPIAVTALDVRLGIECTTACVSAPSASFDNYNLRP